MHLDVPRIRPRRWLDNPTLSDKPGSILIFSFRVHSCPRKVPHWKVDRWYKHLASSVLHSGPPVDSTTWQIEPSDQDRKTWRKSKRKGDVPWSHVTWVGSPLDWKISYGYDLLRTKVPFSYVPGIDRLPIQTFERSWNVSCSVWSRGKLVSPLHVRWTRGMRRTNLIVLETAQTSTSSASSVSAMRWMLRQSKYKCIEHRPTLRFEVSCPVYPTTTHSQLEEINLERERQCLNAMPLRRDVMHGSTCEHSRVQIRLWELYTRAPFRWCVSLHAASACEHAYSPFTQG